MTSRATISPGRLAALLLPPLLAMGVIFFLSAQPSDEIDRAWWDVVLRKLAHFTEYAVLTALWWRALRGFGAQRPLATAMAISLGYAVTDEFHQTFVDGRNGTPVDVLIDAAGIATAAAVVSRLRAAPDARSLAAERGVGERLDRARQPG
jgi:VanZ family protein